MVRLLAIHQTTREAVLDLITGNYERMTRFKAACRMGASEVRVLVPEIRSELVRQKHWFETHAEQFEETVSVLYDLAEDLLPDTPGAAWGRLYRRVAGRTNADSTAKEALEGLLASALREWDQFVCDAGHGHARLYVYAETARSTLAHNGYACDADEVTDAAWELAQELLPKTPAAEWDYTWASELHSHAVEFLIERGLRDVLTTEAEAEYIDRATKAMMGGDRSVYRQALRRWTEAARDAARGSSPAA